MTPTEKEGLGGGSPSADQWGNLDGFLIDRSFMMGVPNCAYLEVLQYHSTGGFSCWFMGGFLHVMMRLDPDRSIVGSQSPHAFPFYFSRRKVDKTMYGHRERDQKNSHLHDRREQFVLVGARGSST